GLDSKLCGAGHVGCRCQITSRQQLAAEQVVTQQFAAKQSIASATHQVITARGTQDTEKPIVTTEAKEAQEPAKTKSIQQTTEQALIAKQATDQAVFSEQTAQQAFIATHQVKHTTEPALIAEQTVQPDPELIAQAQLTQQAIAD